MSCCGRFNCFSSTKQKGDMSHHLLDDKDPHISLTSNVAPITPTSYIPPDQTLLSETDDLLSLSDLQHLPSASCQDHADAVPYYSRHTSHMGHLQRCATSSEGETSWEECQAILADGILSLTPREASEPSQHVQQIHLGTRKVLVMDTSLRQFSLVPVAATVHNSLHTHSPPSGSSMDTITLSTSLDTFSTWLVALEDAIKVCHVKSLQNGVGRSSAAVQWYQQQYETYERAMNTIEFGGIFILHQITRPSYDTNTNDDRKVSISSVRIWLQAEEDDTGLVFLPPGEDEDDPSPALSTPMTTRNTSVSVVERLVDHSCSSGCGPGSGSFSCRGARGSSACGSGSDSIPAVLDIHAPGGYTLPFHLILSVTKGTTEKVTKSTPDSGCFSISTAHHVYVLEADTRSKRDQWAQAVADVVHFCHIPNPNISTKTKNVTL